MTENKSIKCQDCGALADMIGNIPASDTFAGRKLPELLQGGGLYRCQKCSLGFRWPRLVKDELDILYAGGSEVTWSANQDTRRDWRIARRWLKSNLPVDASILDVGCFDGGFLDPLTTIYHCYGIEIHPGARERAKEKNIQIVGGNFSDFHGKFDCITAFDVIEHMEYPARFLEQGLSCLAPSGRFLISTGNLDSFSFWLMGSRYWYCTIAEHISFISPAWIRPQATRHKLEVENIIFFSHEDHGLWQTVIQTTANMIYRFWPKLMRQLRRMGLGGKDVRKHPELVDHPPPWLAARDHFLVVLRKP